MSYPCYCQFTVIFPPRVSESHHHNHSSKAKRYRNVINSNIWNTDDDDIITNLQLTNHLNRNKKIERKTEFQPPISLLEEEDYL